MLLVEMLYEFDVQAIGAVDIAKEDDGEIALYVIFDLNELLLIGSCIRGIGNGQIARYLLLDGHPGRSARFRRGTRQERIHAKMADSEEALDSAAQAGRNSLRK